MPGPAVIVASPFLLERRESWDDGFALYDARDLPAPVRALAEVIATGGDALDPALVASLPNLKLVACFSTGYAGVDYNRLKARGVALTTAAGVNAHDVADHAIALFLTLHHGGLHADRAVREGRWRENLAPRPSLRGRRAGIVGLGRIGMEIAGRTAAFGMDVRWWGPRDKPGAPCPRAENLIALAEWCDVLMVASRATPDNAKQIGAEVLQALGPEGILVNVSRGFLVDEPALLDALDQRRLGGAALDVFETEPVDPDRWRNLDNTVLTPHIAGYTREAGAGMFGQLHENIRRHFAGEPLLTPVEV